MPPKKKGSKKSAKPAPTAKVGGKKTAKKAAKKSSKKAAKKAPAQRRKAKKSVREDNVDLKQKGMTVKERETHTGGVETVAPDHGDAGGAQSLAFTLNPKVKKLTPKVVDAHGRPHDLRFDEGFVYHLPPGLRWQGRDGNGRPGMPASIIYCGPSPEAPADLEDLHPDQVAAYRMGVVQPELAKAEAYITSKTSAGRAKQANLMGVKGIVKVHNAIAEKEGDPLIEELPPLPPAPAGVTVLSARQREVLEAEFSPKRRTTSADRVQEAFAAEMFGEPFFDAEADEDADAAAARASEDAF